jgi:hypothetical protein
MEDSRKPEIILSDQDCQFTSACFVGHVQAEAIKISWSGRKQCGNNIPVERGWRTVKDEEVDRHAYSNGWGLKSAGQASCQSSVLKRAINQQADGRSATCAPRTKSR